MKKAYNSFSVVIQISETPAAHSRLSMLSRFFFSCTHTHTHKIWVHNNSKPEVDKEKAGTFSYNNDDDDANNNAIILNFLSFFCVSK